MIVDCLTAMRESFENAGDEALRTVGDSVLASFQDCDTAFDASKAMQEACRNSPLSVRVGFHWGEAMPDQGDVYGNAVNFAVRISGLATTDESLALNRTMRPSQWWAW